jgi:hypothetical protein
LDIETPKSACRFKRPPARALVVVVAFHPGLPAIAIDDEALAGDQCGNTGRRNVWFPRRKTAGFIAFEKRQNRQSLKSGPAN